MQVKSFAKLAPPMEIKDMLLGIFGIYFALLGFVAWEDFGLDKAGFSFKA